MFRNPINSAISTELLTNTCPERFRKKDTFQIPLGIPSKNWYSLGPTTTTVLGPSNFLFDSSGTCVPPFYREAELQWTIYSNGMPLPFYRTTRLIKSLASTVEGHHSIEDYVLDLDITYYRRNYPELTRGHPLFDRLQLHT